MKRLINTSGKIWNHCIALHRRCQPIVRYLDLATWVIGAGSAILLTAIIWIAGILLIGALELMGGSVDQVT